MLLQLDFSSEMPIYLQIRNGIVQGVAEGKLLPGEKLPPIRVLAEETGVNMMTVNKAYQMLKQEDFICIDRRTGAYVSERMADPLAALEPGMRMLLSKARADGASRSEILGLCERLLDETEVKTK